MEGGEKESSRVNRTSSQDEKTQSSGMKNQRGE